MADQGAKNGMTDQSLTTAYTAGMLAPHAIQCPYCGQRFDILVDPTGGNEQSYIEDCQVCCSPINIEVRMDDDNQAHVTVAGQDEA
jgi:hypothetical protein